MSWKAKTAFCLLIPLSDVSWQEMEINWVCCSLTELFYSWAVCGLKEPFFFFSFLLSWICIKIPGWDGVRDEQDLLLQLLWSELITSCILSDLYCASAMKKFRQKLCSFGWLRVPIFKIKINLQQRKKALEKMKIVFLERHSAEKTSSLWNSVLVKEILIKKDKEILLVAVTEMDWEGQVWSK